MTRASADVFDGATRIGGTLPFVKVCGLTRAVDVRLAVHCGASAVGFVLWPNSPRAVTASGAARLREALPAGVRAVGVFVDATPAEIADAVAWLARAEAVTGQTIFVDGGAHLAPLGRDFVALERD